METIYIKNKNVHKSTSSIICSILGNIFVFTFSISCFYPIIWVLYSSLKDNRSFCSNPIALPKTINFQAYYNIFTQSKMDIWLLNTVRNTVLSLVLILLFGYVIGYFLSRYKFKGRNVLYIYFMIGLVIPIHALMIPMYIMFKHLDILDHWFTLIFPYVAFSLPIAVFLFESYIHSIPIEMEEAATLDGCGFSRSLFSIILPICKPAFITVAILQFFYCWNEFSFALVLINNTNLMTVPVGMTLFKGQYTTDYPSMMAAMLISILPAIIIYFAFSKQIMSGMVTGAVKG